VTFCLAAQLQTKHSRTSASKAVGGLDNFQPAFPAQPVVADNFALIRLWVSPLPLFVFCLWEAQFLKEAVLRYPVHKSKGIDKSAKAHLSGPVPIFGWLYKSKTTVAPRGFGYRCFQLIVVLIQHSNVSIGISTF
jgi:hypothetical protein